MSKDPALLVYTKDFLEGTQDLSAEEFGVFTRLIFHQHQRSFLPVELKKLARLSGVSLSEFEEIWKEISVKFTLTDTGYVNKRCADEIAKRSRSGTVRSILAVFGNWIKANKSLTKKEINLLKNEFSVNDFLDIIDEEERKKSILNKISEVLANAKRTHKANGNGIVNENKDEKENGSVVKESEELIFPFESENFKEQWKLWKTFKKKEHKFNYRTMISEQAALKKIASLSGGDEKTAIAIIHQSIENGWKGFFELKNVSNGKGSSKKNVQYSDDFKRKLIEKLQSG